MTDDTTITIHLHSAYSLGNFIISPSNTTIHCIIATAKKSNFAPPFLVYDNTSRENPIFHSSPSTLLRKSKHPNKTNNCGIDYNVSPPSYAIRLPSSPIANTCNSTLNARRKWMGELSSPLQTSCASCCTDRLVWSWSIGRRFTFWSVFRIRTPWIQKHSMQRSWRNPIGIIGCKQQHWRWTFRFRFAQFGSNTVACYHYLLGKDCFVLY